MPSQEEKERQQAKAEKNQRINEIKDMQDILSIPAGQRFIQRLIEEARLFEEPFTGNSQTFFNCGWNAFGRFLLSEIAEANPVFAREILIPIKKENAND